MKTSTLCTACAAITLLAAGLAGVINPEPGRGNARWSSPLSIASDALAAWAVPAAETEITRLPLPIRPSPRPVAAAPRTSVKMPQAPLACLLVDAPWVDAEVADLLIVAPAPSPVGATVIENVRRTLKRIEIEKDRSSDTCPATSSQARAVVLRHRA